jgi:hypothetical protein
MFAAGIQRLEVLRWLPGGTILSHAIIRGHVTRGIMDRAVEDHFRLLRQAAAEEAREEGILIVKHILSCPDYLCEWEDETEGDRYQMGKGFRKEECSGEEQGTGGRASMPGRAVHSL